MSSPTDEVNNSVDEMILKAFRIVTKGVRFLDVLEEDRQSRAPAVTLMPTVLEESYVPPTPPADRTTFGDARSISNSTDAASRVADYGSSTSEPSDETQTANSTNSRLSTGRSTGTSSRLSQNSQRTVSFNRLSSNIAHRVSLAGPSPLSRPQNLVSERLSTSHDTFLSHLGSFIGRLHLQSQARPHLALAIKQSATSGGELLIVVDVVCAHSALTKEILEQPRAAMYDRILDLVHAASDILLYNSGAEMADIIFPQDNHRLLSAATGCVRATGECVAKTKWVIERIGDFELEFEDGSLGIDLDLGVLDAIEQERERAGSIASIPEIRAAKPISFSKPLPKDKPLPEVPRKASPSTEGPEPLPMLLPPRRDSLRFSDGNTSDSTTSISSMRPNLPPLPKLSTTALPAEDCSPSDTSAGFDSDGRSSYQRESLVGPNSATNSAYLNRDSETSLMSQTSTRATTPDLHHAPKNQPSLSELSATNSNGEEVEEVESKIMEKTYAQELMFNKEGQVVGGSLPALVERLTTHEATPDAIFVSTFFLTFRLFCTPVELVEALVDRFEYVGDAPRMAGPVRLRVYNVFKQWLESHWRDETDHGSLSLIKSFAEVKLTEALPSAGKRLLDLTQRVSATHATLVPRFVSSVGKGNTSISPHVVDTPMPAPALTKSHANSLAAWKAGGNCPAILDFDPLEIARQLTIKQMNIFCAIMPEELLGSEWMKKAGAGSPNVKAMTALSTDLSNYVAETILHYNEVKKRAAVIKQWIKVGHQCLELHNYDALMAIICSLNSSTITRLRKTWDVVSLKRREMLKTLQAVVEPAQNHKALRAQLSEHVPPCLPFQGMFLTDLTFVDIGNPATKQLQGADGKDMTVVNYDKHSRTAKIIGELQRFQVSYRITELPDMQDWIQAELDRVRESDPKKNVQVSYYRKSLLLEPRETQAQRTPVESPGSANGQNMFSWRKTGIRSEKS